MTIKELKEKHNLTGARIGVLTGTSPRTVRGWLAQKDAVTHSRAPLSVLWLLRILLGDATPEQIISEAESRIKKGKNIEKCRMTQNSLDK